MGAGCKYIHAVGVSVPAVSVDLSGVTRHHVIRRLLPAAEYFINVKAVSPAGVTSHAASVTTRGTVGRSL